MAWPCPPSLLVSPSDNHSSEDQGMVASFETGIDLNLLSPIRTTSLYRRFVGGFKVEAEELSSGSEYEDPNTPDSANTPSSASGSGFYYPFPEPQIPRTLTDGDGGVGASHLELRIGPNFIEEVSQQLKVMAVQDPPHHYSGSPNSKIHPSPSQDSLSSIAPASPSSLLAPVYWKVATDNVRNASTSRRRSTKPGRTLYVCNLCGADFTRNKNLLNHRLVHFNLRPYRCEFCEKRFTTKHTKKRHCDKKHPSQ